MRGTSGRDVHQFGAHRLSLELLDQEQTDARTVVLVLEWMTRDLGSQAICRKGEGAAGNSRRHQGLNCCGQGRQFLLTVTRAAFQTVREGRDPND